MLLLLLFIYIRNAVTNKTPGNGHTGGTGGGVHGVHGAGWVGRGHGRLHGLVI